MHNSSATFSGQLIGAEEFLNHMVETLDISVDKQLIVRPRKRENLIIE